MNVLRSHILQINVVNFGAELNVMRHAGRSSDEVKREGRVRGKLRRITRFTRKIFSVRFRKPKSILFFYLLDDFKQACSPGNPVTLQGRGNRKTDGFFRAACIRDHEIGGHRVKTAAHALRRRIKRL